DRSVRRLHDGGEPQVHGDHRGDRHQAGVMLDSVIARESGRSSTHGDSVPTSCPAYAGHDVARLYLSNVTFTLSPTLTDASAVTSPNALAKMLHGLARRVSPPLEIGVRPKPMAIAGPSGQ